MKNAESPDWIVVSNPSDALFLLGLSVPILTEEEAGFDGEEEAEFDGEEK